MVIALVMENKSLAKQSNCPIPFSKKQCEQQGSFTFQSHNTTYTYTRIRRDKQDIDIKQLPRKRLCFLMLLLYHPFLSEVRNFSLSFFFYAAQQAPEQDSWKGVYTSHGKNHSTKRPTIPNGSEQNFRRLSTRNCCNFAIYY